ncbi:uncharacterized protein LOC133032047 [Cannabis sativa]|uniref:uncharacterized protein LOC133032047 n=1 Tax=Cannabis sativa TaxID=3483 RepID=UPI0029CA7287|nr:uncharacterized protein LOC133032047 [Cannabis sativa]
MKLISWNARGLGNPGALRHLRLLVQQQSPHVLFLMETKLADNSITRLRLLLKFSNGLEVARIGLSGGIMLLWSDEIDVTLLNMGPTFFDCYMKFNGSPSFHFTGFYGAPDLASKSASWTLFQRFGDVAPLLPWLAIGDFNEILSNNDKSGGSFRRESHMEAFRTSLDKYFLQEVPYNGDPFTWTKNRTTPHALKERLDWCFINNKWSTHFHLPTVDHLDYFNSDHRAIAVSFSFLSQTETPARSKSRFRFEKLWLADPESVEIIMKSWNSSIISDPITAVLDNLSTCAKNLQSWHIGKYGKMKKTINSLQSKVADLNNSNSSSSDHFQELHNAEIVLEDLLEQEEVYWQQRSRVDWLSCGDRNTKFFHAKASSRKSNNKIKFLHNSLGQKVYSKEDIAAVVQAFYSDLFSSTSVDEEALNSTLSCIPTTVSAELNASLVKPFTPDEVYTALHSMGPDKSPGIDGMSAMFYQKNWTTVGDLVTKVVLSILNDNADPTALNKTLITLIPKVKKPQHIQEYRPISLCNVISKLVTKVLVSRFKLALPMVISEEQSAFLPNRLITDNVLVAFELVHAIKNKTAGRNGIASFKLDMSKAFDRVEWKFIEEVMRKMGFAERWISLIMSCLTTNNFSFIINGEVMGDLTPSRGLRQGCPLSPYLFLICSEGFSRLLQHEQESHNLMGFKLTRHVPPITHLFFADDSLLFCQANERSCLAIKRVLDTYHKASGQELNLDKSVMSFSPNTTLAAQVFFHQQLSMPICECHEKYLGLPSYSGRDKKEMFSNIKERIWKLMNSWNEKIFSAGGKEILLKAVVQSIPTYAMSCFRLPAYFCKQVESMMANFWWGLTENGSRIHWRSWNLLCKSKLEGGMGFRSFIHFNQALLAKQAWRIFEKPHSLLGRILKSRYFPNNNFLEASLGHSPSLTWQGIHWARELLIKGLRWKVGDGRHIQSGFDPWIPGHNTFLPFHYSGPSNGVVSNLITDERQWDLPLLQQFFSALDVERILSVPLSFFSSRDVLIWHHHSSGLYTVKSGYHLAADIDIIDQSSSSNRDSHWWKFFWSLQLPPKVKIFAWRAIHDALPVATSLVKRKVITDSTCSVCKQAWESVGHALFSCKYAKAVWRHSNLVFDWRLSAAMYKGDYILHLSTIYSKAEMEQIFCSLWTIWTERNRIVHGHKARPAKDLASYALTGPAATCTYQQPLQSSASAPLAPTSYQQPQPQVVPVAQQWRPPEANGYKLNVDAAIDVHQKVIGIGAIIRDSNGNVVAAFSKQQPGNFSSHEMEAIALFQSLNWVIQQQLPISLVESDALMVVNALRAPFNSISSFHDLIVDVLCLLSFLSDVTITHVKREANMAAHCLAKFALGVDEACFWFEEIPPPIYSVICWFAAGLASGVVADQTFGNWFVAAAARWNDDNLRLAVMLCWAIWQARNDQVWKGNSRTSRYILALAGGNLNQWRYAQDKTFVPSQFNLKPNEGGELWTKPVGNTIKINVDAAIFESQNRYGYGWVARNNEGRLLWAKSSSFCGNVSAEFAEALGLKEVLSWLKDNDLSNVVVESDSLVTIQAVRSSIFFSSTFGFCVTECQSLLSNLCDVDLCFIKRSANRVAHHLARASVSYADCMYRESNAPATLMDVRTRATISATSTAHNPLVVDATVAPPPTNESADDLHPHTDHAPPPNPVEQIPQEYIHASRSNPVEQSSQEQIHVPRSNPVDRPPYEDIRSPYYLSNADHPGLVLATPILTDRNFQPWKRDFKISIGARNKTPFWKFQKTKDQDLIALTVKNLAITKTSAIFDMAFPLNMENIDPMIHLPTSIRNQKLVLSPEQLFRLINSQFHKVIPNILTQCSSMSTADLHAKPSIAANY